MPTQMAHPPPRTQLKPEEAALLAGELKKPSWQSRNEGIHERVSFEDSIWGFDLAGGSFYKTPLRVTAVKTDSRADKAGIRPGDKLLRINDIDTSTLTIQEAHEIIIESGIHLRIAVTAPEDLEDSYHCWEDVIEDGYDSEEERRRQKVLEEKRVVHAKVSSYWSLQWPWVSKRRVIYRESNCFLVPSKYENKHKDKFTEQPVLKTTDDVVLFSSQNEENLKYKSGNTPPQSPISNGINDKKPDFQKKSDNSEGNVKENGVHNKKIDQIPEEIEDFLVTENGDGTILDEILDKDHKSMTQEEEDKILNGVLSDESELVESVRENLVEDLKQNGVEDDGNLSSKDLDTEPLSHSEIAEELAEENNETEVSVSEDLVDDLIQNEVEDDEHLSSKDIDTEPLSHEEQIDEEINEENNETEVANNDQETNGEVISDKLEEVSETNDSVVEENT